MTARKPATRQSRREPTALQRLGRQWRRLRSWEQWVLGVLVAYVLAAPFSAISEVARLAAALTFVALGVAVVVRSSEAPAVVRVPTCPEASLLLSDSLEARVASAASRAWLETLREPCWKSPYLTHSRAVVDGGTEVEQIIESANRVHVARDGLGARPSGTAGQYWDQQKAALDRAAGQLGSRAGALMTYREQAGKLSVVLADLSELQRMERSAMVVHGLTVPDTSTFGRSGNGVVGLSAEVAGARRTMVELLDLMTRTRSLMAETSLSAA